MSLRYLETRVTSQTSSLAAKPRVLLLVDCYFPAAKSSAKLVHDLGVEISRQGCGVVVATASDVIAQPLEISREDGLTVLRVRAGRIKGASKLVRAINESLLSSTLWRCAGGFLRQNPCDLVVFYSPTIFFSGLVRRLKSLWRCPAYMILRDIFPQWAVDAGVLRRYSPIYAYFRAMEKRQHRVADVIGVQTTRNLEYFAQNFPGGRFTLEVLYNWTALNEPEVPHTDYRRRLGLSDRFVFFYGGNMGVAQDMDNLLRLARSLRDHPRIHFLLVGEGSETTRLNRSIAAEGLSNIQLLPSVGQNEYLGMLSEFDVGLISLHRRLTTHNVPGKLLGYLHFGMPTLASINAGNDLQHILERGEAGLCTINGDDEGLRRNALRLAEDADLRKRMGASARRLLETVFSDRAAAKQVLRHLPARGVLHQCSPALNSSLCRDT